MNKKIKRNFYLPEWVTVLLDEEAPNFKGPGNLVSAAITAFYRMSKDEKLKAILKFRELDAKAEFVIKDGVNIEEAAKLLLAESEVQEAAEALERKKQKRKPAESA